MKKQKTTRYMVHHYVDAEQYEYVARLAVATPKGNMHKVIESIVFGRRWRKELEELRITQRKLGFKDYEFLPPAIRKKLGYKVIAGPRPRSKFKVKK